MKKKGERYVTLIVNIFKAFEIIVALMLSLILGLIIVLSLVALIRQSYVLIQPTFITNHISVNFEDYQDLFGKVMVVIISSEFLRTILKVLKPHKVHTIVQDVVLISVLAIGHELIIIDYVHTEYEVIIAISILMVAVGLFYILIKRYIYFNIFQ